MTVDNDDTAAALIGAIRSGDLDSLHKLLNGHPGLAAAPIGAAGGRTPLHVATDWPGYYSNGPAVIAMLIAAGADPNTRTEGGPAPETPLHWAASSDDADVAEALIDGGADIEAPGGSIGTPLDNAIGYGCWHVARLLTARGAQVGKLWHAAALGMMNRVEELLATSPAPGPGEITEAFWQACHGGQRRAAEYLLAHGADINATPGYSQQTAIDIAAAPSTRRDILVTWLREQGARCQRGASLPRVSLAPRSLSRGPHQLGHQDHPGHDEDIQNAVGHATDDPPAGQDRRA